MNILCPLANELHEYMDLDGTEKVFQDHVGEII